MRAGQGQGSPSLLCWAREVREMRVGRGQGSSPLPPAIILASALARSLFWHAHDGVLCPRRELNRCAQWQGSDDGATALSCRTPCTIRGPIGLRPHRPWAMGGPRRPPWP
eukprot:775118-Pyramimonas_sp.AAC.1